MTRGERRAATNANRQVCSDCKRIFGLLWRPGLLAIMESAHGRQSLVNGLEGQTSYWREPRASPTGVPRFDPRCSPTGSSLRPPSRSTMGRSAVNSRCVDHTAQAIDAEAARRWDLALLPASDHERRDRMAQQQNHARQTEACGFRNPHNLQAAIYFHCGGLDLYAR